MTQTHDDATQPLSDSYNAFLLASTAARLADDKKANNIVLLEIKPVSTLADFFVIVSVNSRTQMISLADTLSQSLKEQFGPAYGMDRDKSGHWTVIDYADVVIHVLNNDDREYYQLERFWNHARQVPRDEWASVALQRKAS
ncbi:MAG: ribosome silencing factor [Cyanobacteria bacterium HKST-UBA06]|nr:ribosome silencing factor [Cyanobacteria bacterium HKST-UBA05]MCA9798886.1 ribosome silencing factor [Cyanobacteria bacterium HKST-UBA04]MCA9807428.1 ribosome silencing factor [Cyanobacteria bacterium HKST-UBA06]MCA9841308.1 ribosome silencing factor [Cyanobacteria bacterium HKST-UBA03]